jgi:hypothetical protein
MKKLRCMVLLFTALWSVGVAAPVLGEDTYHGRVVDEQTDQPLVGAAVTVIWFRSPILGLESTRDFHSAQETVTDSQGKFSLSVSPGIDWNPFTYIRKEPQIVVYQPGFEPTWAGWMDRNNYNSGVELAEALKKGTTIRLQQVKTEDQRRFADLGAVAHTVVPHHAIPILVRVVNVQRKLAGITSLYAEPVRGRKVK